MGTGKKNLKNGATIIFIDEIGYSLTPTIHRTWAKKGHIPEIRSSGSSWNKLSAISGLAVQYQKNEYNTQLYFRLYPGQTISSKEIINFLRQILYQVNGNVIVIWDNLKAHRAKKVKAYSENITRLDIEYLPPYSPDMNPDEGVWNWSTTKDLVNTCPSSATHLLHLVRGSLRRIQRRKHIQRWCLEQSMLSFN